MKTTLLNLILFFLSLTSFSQFGPKNNLSYTQDFPGEIEAHDLDLDGDLDIIRTMEFKIVWYENFGDEIFSIQKVLHRDDEVDFDSFIVMDYDNDGDKDIVAHTDIYLDQEIILIENYGDGTFNEPSIIVAGEYLFYDLEVTDINGDGFEDILCLNIDYSDEQIIWLKNNGDGTFSDVLSIYDFEESLQGLYAITSADLNGDGLMDIAYVLRNEDEISWQENLDGENFGPKQIISTSQEQPRGIKNADFDLDGDMDLLVTTDLGSVLHWYANDGEGNFVLGQVVSSGIYTAKSISVGDLDDDGDEDIILANINPNRVVWFQNDGSGNFSSGIIIENSLRSSTPVFITDLDLDGDLDLLSHSTHDHMAIWCPNDGFGNFETLNMIDVMSSGVQSLREGDIDGDGFIDIAVGSGSNSVVGWYKNNGNEGFGPLIPVYYIEANYHNEVDLADLDNDGDLDMLYGSSQDNNYQWLPNDGFGEFGDPIIIATGSINATDMILGDFDNDLDEDLILALDPYTLELWINDGFGNFTFSQLITLDFYSLSSSLEVSDVDLDGDLDLFVADAWLEEIFYHPNDGSGNFGSKIILSDTADPSQGGIADLDNDGDLDLFYMILGWDTSQLAIQLNNGDLTFGGPILFGSVPISALNILAEDIDLDGDQDIIVGECPGGAKYFENDGNANFYTSSFIGYENDCPTYLHFGDLNGDGTKDLIIEDQTNNEIYWFENESGQGCLDSEACNYDPEAVVDDGSCCFGICGCDDINATNYNFEVECNDGNCLYNINGIVFHDENINGEQGEFEQSLSSFEVTLEPLGLIVFTNGEGQFLFPEVPQGDYSISVTFTDAFPYPTTENPLEFEVSDSYVNGTLYFGLNSDTPHYELDVNLYSIFSTYTCLSPSMHHISVTNQGNVTIDVEVELTIDTLFTGYGEISSIDLVEENIIHFSTESLVPGESIDLNIELISPNSDYIGYTLLSNVVAIGIFDELEIASDSDTIDIPLTCSYDPNDKQANPLGWTDEHFILNDTEIEYFIRFQNTGNAPATNVHVIDTIDPFLDLSTFEFVATSHDVLTTINSVTREVDFFFENIMLPDSVNFEDQSHGFVSFKIRPIEDLPLYTEINNTANIYFDLNEPVVTNTTWNTIYNCDFYESSFEADGTLLTAQESVSYQWLLESEPISGAISQTYEFDTDGNYSLETTNELGCVYLTSQEFLTVGIETYENQKDLLRLIPNPMLESSTVFLGENHNYSYARIVDSNGKIVRDLGQINTDILVIKKEALGEGLYFIELFSSSIVDNITLKLIIR